MPEQRKVLLSATDENVRYAVDVLRAGGLVAFPTETVYGLGADALDAAAVLKIFEAKHRPTFDPLILHAESAARAFEVCSEVPDLARTLAERFWPGPLTLVLPKTSNVPDVATSGLPTVAVRVPSHPVAQALLQGLGRPIAAPSANVFGYTSPTTARAVMDDLGQRVDVVLDDGPCPIGVESTVLRIEGKRAFLLRPGGVTLEELGRYVAVETVASVRPAAPESPGQLDAHYAPWTPLYFYEEGASGLDAAAASIVREARASGRARPRLGAIFFGRRSGSEELYDAVENLSASGDLREAATRLFEVVRKLDKMNLDVLVAAAVPEEGIGSAINDRLRRASRRGAPPSEGPIVPA